MMVDLILLERVEKLERAADREALAKVEQVSVSRDQDGLRALGERKQIVIARVG